MSQYFEFLPLIFDPYDLETYYDYNEVMSNFCLVFIIIGIIITFGIFVSYFVIIQVANNPSAFYIQQLALSIFISLLFSPPILAQFYYLISLTIQHAAMLASFFWYCIMSFKQVDHKMNGATRETFGVKLKITASVWIIGLILGFLSYQSYIFGISWELVIFVCYIQPLILTLLLSIINLIRTRRLTQDVSKLKGLDLTMYPIIFSATWFITAICSLLYFLALQFNINFYSVIGIMGIFGAILIHISPLFIGVAYAISLKTSKDFSKTDLDASGSIKNPLVRNLPL